MLHWGWVGDVSGSADAVTCRIHHAFAFLKTNRIDDHGNKKKIKTKTLNKPKPQYIIKSNSCGDSPNILP